MSSPVTLPGTSPLRVGDKVRTPSGRMADLLAIVKGEDGRLEGLVMWSKSEDARILLKLLKPWRE